MIKKIAAIALVSAFTGAAFAQPATPATPAIPAALAVEKKGDAIKADARTEVKAEARGDAPKATEKPAKKVRHAKQKAAEVKPGAEQEAPAAEAARK